MPIKNGLSCCADLPDIVSIMAACAQHLESIKPPPPAVVNWSLTPDHLDCHCKHCVDAMQELKRDQQTFELTNKFKRGSKQKLEHVAQ